MTRHWVKLELDVRAFDPARFTGYIERCRTAGIHSTTLAELGDTERHTTAGAPRGAGAADHKRLNFT